MRTTAEQRAAMRAASQECLDAMVGWTLDDLPSDAHRAVVGASQAIVDLLHDLDEVVSDRETLIAKLDQVRKQCQAWIQDVYGRDFSAGFGRTIRIIIDGDE